MVTRICTCTGLMEVTASASRTTNETGPVSSLDASVFADARDMQLWRWAVERFESELAVRGLTRGRAGTCATKVCAAAADQFIE